MIKNENDLLGILIKNKDQNNMVEINLLKSIADIDQFSLQELISRLSAKKYLLPSMSAVTLTDLGIRNYVSPRKKFAMWMAKMLVLTVKNLLFYVAGIISGILVSYFSNRFIG